jgi:hypothetical protein
LAVAVQDVGAIRVGDLLQIGTNAARTYAVDSLDSRTQITIHSLTGDSTVVSGERLVITSNKPTVYSSPAGNVVPPTTITSSLGTFQAYVYEQAVDYILSAAGVTSVLVSGQQTGAVSDFFNVLDFGAVGDDTTIDGPAIQRLINLAVLTGSSGGQATVFFPRGIYRTSTLLNLGGLSAGGTNISNLHLYGEPGATIKLNSATWDNSSAMLAIDRTGVAVLDNLHISGLTIDGSGIGSAGTPVIGLRLNGVSNSKISNCTFTAIGHPNAGATPENDGIQILGTSSYVDVTGCRFQTIERNGIAIISLRQGNISRCAFSDIESSGIAALPTLITHFARNIRIYDNHITNPRDAAIRFILSGAVSGTLNPIIFDENIISSNIIETSSSSGTGIRISNFLDCIISNNNISGHNASSGATGIRLSSSQGCVISENCIHDMGDMSFTGILVDSAFTSQGRSNRISNNVLHDINGGAIDIDGQQDCIISGNIIHTYGASHVGILVRESGAGVTARNVVMGNVLDTGHTGISILSSAVDDTVLIGNIVHNSNTADYVDAGTRSIHIGNRRTAQTGNSNNASELSTLISGAAPLSSGRPAWAIGVTLAVAPATTTTVTNANATTNSRITLLPTNALAAAHVGSAGGVHVSSKAAGSFVITHPSDAGSATFDCLIFEGGTGTG